MADDKITWGESYDLSVSAADSDGEPLPLDETWQAAARVILERTGREVENIAMVIADGAAIGSIDTRADGYSPGLYAYDVRLTDPDGNDYWSERVRLTLASRVTPSSL